MNEDTSEAAALSTEDLRRELMPAGARGRSPASPLRACVQALVELLYPPECIGCGASVAGGLDAALCARCRGTLRRIGKDRCPRCGFAFGPHVAGREACPACHGGVAFRQAVAVFRYEGCVREAIHRWKYRGDLRAGASLCDMLLEALRQEEFMGSVQVVIPVPLHWVRRLRRRFNQSEFLARAVARRFGVGFAPGVLRRIRNTPSQVGLTPAERHQNVRDAFRVVRPWALRGRTVLLVDDVLTTCATAGECARTLRGAGAGCVYVAALAR